MRQDKPADLILTNGVVYTADDKRPIAQAVAVRDGKIVVVGVAADVRKVAGSSTRVIDLQGKTVLPGMTDSHCHIIGIGLREMTLNLEGVASLEEFLKRIAERVAQTKPGDWITGRGWIETFWKPPVFPTRQDLDRVASQNPVFLTRADGHASVANSKTLDAAKIYRNTANPFGGEISKDANGDPNGMLLDAAQKLVSLNIPQSNNVEEAVRKAVQRSLSLGWTQLQDAGGTFADISFFRRLYERNEIPLRIYKAVYGPGREAETLLRQGAMRNAYDNRLTVRTIKVIFDGALGSRGAALLAPYADKPDTSGFLTTKEEELVPLLREALRQGIQVETHAIGDKANRRILDLYQDAFAAVPPADRKVREPRWRVEHAQIVSTADLPRFRKLGVIPSMQPSHAIGDLFFATRRLDPPRLQGAYAWQTLLKSGVIIAGGSDAPVERGEPLIEFYAAVTRKSIKGESGPDWHLEQRVSRTQALKMFTLWPAYAAFEENLRGSITPGKLADFTIFDIDIMKIPEPEILKARCMMTILSGKVAYEG